MNWGNIYNRGIMISFRQNKDGALTWGFGQRYVKYDVWEEKFSIANYIDFFSCYGQYAKNGHYFFNKYFASKIVSMYAQCVILL
ncbi:hypothetical protein KII59_000756 [Campylobacter jejuni]|nr:hypothetical protein [Campylobacter jejuni]